MNEFCIKMSNLSSLNLIEHGTEKILSKKNLLEKIREDRPLNIKFGCDPTAPNLHIGHMVIINKLAQLQKMGHHIHFIIGDFTAFIGDPTGRNSTRPMLNQEEISKNVKTYQDQIFRFLQKDKTFMHKNSDWLNKVSLQTVIKLSSKQTIARMLERKDFNLRFRGNKPIAIHELLYPLIQAYDSVHIKADIELGGTDQEFNLLMGREIQKSMNLKQQVAITMPILQGTDGIKKMSKSLDNHIGINDTPENMFGKIMSIPDSLMWTYYRLVLLSSEEEVESYKISVKQGENPSIFKYDLAKKIVTKFYTKEKSEVAFDDFTRRFKHKTTPRTIPEFIVSSSSAIPVSILLKKVGFCKSTSEAMRLIEQKAIKVDGLRVLDKKFLVQTGTSSIYQVGKRKFLRIIVNVQSDSTTD